MKNPLRLLAVLCLFLPRALWGQEPEPVVHAVLFYSPTCPHCHQVITEYLIPLQNRFGNRLVILGMDTTRPEANNLYWEAIRFFRVPEENWAVPFLVVGDEVLVGGIEIPSRFTTIVEAGLASGGIDLPDYPALRTFLQEQDLLDPRFPDRMVVKPRPSPEPEQGAPASDQPGEPVQEEPAADTLVGGAPAPSGDSTGASDTTAAGVEPGGRDTTTAEVEPDARDTANREVEPGPQDTMATEPEGGPGDTVLEANAAPRTPPGAAAETGSAGGMIRELNEAVSDLESMTMWDRFRLDPVGNGVSVLVLLVMCVSLLLRGVPGRSALGAWPSWAVPVLVSAGVFVAGYLSFVEVTQVQAVCGPVGDCNTVNQSEYAMLFGRIPVGLLGLAGYAAILVLWLVARAGPAGARRPATLGLWLAVLFGVLFSVYLTFLEPFVIGASCAWCLTSAMIMTLLLWAVAPLVSRVRFGQGETRGEE